MIRKGTWIVLAVFILLAGGVLILQNTQGTVKLVNDVTPSPTSQPLLLEGWQAEDIAYIEIKRDGLPLVLSQAEDGSWLLDPDANSIVVDASLVDALRNSLTVTRVLAEIGADSPLDSFGLSAPNIVITLRSKLGKQSELGIGAITPTNSGYYVQVDGNQPVVVSKLNIESVLQQLALENWVTPEPIEAVSTPTPAP